MRSSAAYYCTVFVITPSLMHYVRKDFIFFALLIALAGCGARPSPDAGSRSPAPVEPPVLNPVLLHLPGIGGERFIDRALVNGLTTGGISAEIEIYDWTDNSPGLKALVARERNEAQAQIVADWIEQRFREDPRRTIYLTSHSGGAGIATWALEKLPDDVKVDALLFVAPALSPGYDLSTALKHVRGKAYNLYSPFDPVLGFGTRLFGTIDGVKTDAAGKIGFNSDNASDKTQYAKLEQIPYDPTWRQARNIGDHVGAMNRTFARLLLAPLLSTGVLPILPPLQPATTRAAVPVQNNAER